MKYCLFVLLTGRKATEPEKCVRTPPKTQNHRPSLDARGDGFPSVGNVLTKIACLTRPCVYSPKTVRMLNSHAGMVVRHAKKSRDPVKDLNYPF